MIEKNNEIKNYLGVDWGEKRIGLAIGDSENMIATPFQVIKGISELKNIVNKEEIDIIIVGLPKKLDQKTSRSYKEVKKFIIKLKSITNVEIKTVDERLTSKAFDKLEGSNKAKAPKDAVAAMLILQTFLDITKNNK